MESKGTSFAGIVTVFGAIMIACGFAWLIAQNWRVIPDLAKVGILLLVTAASLWGGSFAREREYVGTGKALILLGAALYALTVFLVAQIYHIDAGVQGFAWLTLLAAAGVVALAYVFRQPSVLAFGLVITIVWSFLQWVALVEGIGDMVIAVPFAIALLSLAAVGFGLMAVHRAQGHPFGNTYRALTAFSLLGTGYFLSFQLVLPILWEGSFTTGAFAYTTGFLVAAVASTVAAVTIGNGSLTRRESLGFAAATGTLLLGVILAALVRGSDHLGGYLFGGSMEVSPALWAVWAVVNLLFLGVILLVLGEGTQTGSRTLVNIGITFFGLLVVTRYLGFLIDFWGTTGMPLLFITGGLLLLGGGFGIERWRRSLLANAPVSAVAVASDVKSVGSVNPTVKPTTAKQTGGVPKPVAKKSAKTAVKPAALPSPGAKR